MMEKITFAEFTDGLDILGPEFMRYLVNRGYDLRSRCLLDWEELWDQFTKELWTCEAPKS